MRIAFLGLGNMGLPMASNLLELGHTVAVYNRTPGKAKALLTQGAFEAHSVADVVKDAEVAITMLSDDSALTEVVHGPSGLLQNLPPRAIHLCMGTIGVETSAALASAHAQANQGYVAAPVFGRAETAASRHVWIVAGGPEPQVNRCRPIFDALGRGYTRVGPNAAVAHALKLGGNMLTIAMELAVAELLIFAKKAGLPPADYLRFLNTAIFRSHMVDTYGSATARPSFDPEDQTLDLAANELLLETSRDMGAHIPVSDLLNARLQAAGARGWGEQDLAELSEACRLETGLEETVRPLPAEPATPPPAPESVESTPPKPKKEPTPKEPVPLPPVEATPIPLLLREEEPPPPPRSKKTPTPKEARPIPPVAPRPAPPIAREVPHTAPSQSLPANLKEAANPKGISPQNPFTAMAGKEQVTLDLEKTSHFELSKSQVWAWSQGQRYATRWSKFSEVELAFSDVLFLLIQRRILLRPEAVLDLRSTFGGGAKARVSDDIELDVSRAAASRLKVLLGM